jgi:hypothetical protein
VKRSGRKYAALVAGETECETVKKLIEFFNNPPEINPPTHEERRGPR